MITAKELRAKHAQFLAEKGDAPMTSSEMIAYDQGADDAIEALTFGKSPMIARDKILEIAEKILGVPQTVPALDQHEDFEAYVCSDEDVLAFAEAIIAECRQPVGVSKPEEAISYLRAEFQKQLDADGIMVGVSRQALEETLEWIDHLATAAPKESVFPLIDLRDNPQSAPGWIKVNSEADLPKKPGLKPYEQIDCMVIHKGDMKHLVWNCEHLVWDDASGDDFYCNATEPTYYMPLEWPSQPQGKE